MLFFVARVLRKGNFFLHQIEQVNRKKILLGDVYMCVCVCNCTFSNYYSSLFLSFLIACHFSFVGFDIITSANYKLTNVLCPGLEKGPSNQVMVSNLLTFGCWR